MSENHLSQFSGTCQNILTCTIISTLKSKISYSKRFRFFKNVVDCMFLHSNTSTVLSVCTLRKKSIGIRTFFQFHLMCWNTFGFVTPFFTKSTIVQCRLSAFCLDFCKALGFRHYALNENFLFCYNGITLIKKVDRSVGFPKTCNTPSKSYPSLLDFHQR